MIKRGLKLAILGASDFQNPLILKAKEMGLETHVFAWQCGDIGEKTADYFHPISVAEKEEIAKVCQKEGISAITTCGSDFAVITQNFVAEKLGLPSNPVSTTLKCTNKFAMREALQAAGIPTPKHIKVTKENQNSEEIKLALANLPFPLIVKPTDRSGSRAIKKVENQKELFSAIDTALQASFSHEAIVEEMIEGPEYSCESITYKGKHHTLTLTKKFTTGAPNFIETGHLQPSDIKEEKIPKVISQIHTALTALGIENSASHAEFRLQPDGEVRIIEIGARMGGDCIGSDLTELSTGQDYLRATIQVARGLPPDLTPTHQPQKAKITFLLNKEDLKNFETKIKPDPAIHLIRWHLEPNLTQPVTDSSTRLGYYITVS